MNRLSLFLIGVGAGLTLVAALRPRHHPVIQQALLERSQVRYLN